VSITATVEVAMKEWADLSVAGKSSPEIDVKVVNAHNKYRASCQVALDALRAYKISQDPTQYNAAIAQAKVAAWNLIELITPLLVPDKSTELKTNLTNATVL
jgi:hypothetical protein